MKILLTGASGFIGRNLVTTLLHAGHTLVCAVRKPPNTSSHERVSYVGIDFNKAVSPAAWTPALDGVDVVINAVGILREAPGQTFDVIHRAAPTALFAAAAEAGVRHVVQMSALGADENARSGYHLSKKAADEFLLRLPVRASIVQPSLVYGPGGASAALFELFSSLPVTMLPGGGRQMVQPVHIDDLVLAIQALIESTQGDSGTIAMVGPTAITLRDFYSSLRKGMGISRPPRFLPVPMPLMRFIARAGSRLPGGFLDSDTLAMLERGNTAPPDAIRALLGRAPRGVQQFVPPAYARAAGMQAKMRWLLPILRISIGLVWLVTGIVSLGIYPVESSYALLARTGTPENLMPLFLYGAAALDIALGILTLLPRRSRWLWAGQAALVLGYTIIISWKIPEFWLHPYGPILKNLPFLAGLWILYELEERSWNT